MKIGIYGSGMVGYAVGRGLEEVNGKEHEVMFYDLYKEKLNKIAEEGHKVAKNPKEIVENSEIIFVCVPTPSKNKGIDLSCMKAAVKEIGKQLGKKEEYTLVIAKSTITPTTTEKLVIPLLEKYSGKKAGKDFGVCFNPEFLRDKHALEDFENPDRIVIGQYDERSGEMLEKLYSAFACPIIRTDLKTAEMSKYASNNFYSTKISFFNEIHLICEKIGADSQIVRKIVQLDRFYPTHPWEHGHAFDGKCLPKDLDALIHFAVSNKICNPVLLKAVRVVNEKIAAIDTK